MRVLGFEITLKRAAGASLAPVWGHGPGGSGMGNWYPVIRESYPGAWQQNVTLEVPHVLAFHAVFACVTLISSDIGKLRFKLVEQSSEGVWSETDSPAFSPFLRQPNAYQNHVQFKEWWLVSKLTRGNTYMLKGRDARGVVVAGYVLDPCKTLPLVAPSGEVFYQLGIDNLAGLQDDGVIVPASEIIHDRMNCLYHPLVGLSPLYACAAVATQGLAMQGSSTALFQNMARPAGILTAPGHISDPTAQRIKEYWETNYAGSSNFGKTAVLGDDVKYQALTQTASDSQLVEQMKLTAEMVCTCFHVPPFKIGIGPQPTYNNAEIFNSIYYSDCLQSLIEQMETALDDGLGLNVPKEGRRLGVELDLDQLLRMDSATMIDVLGKGVGAGIVSPNEARKRLEYGSVKGGKSPYLQQQNFSLEALAERDANAPFAKPAAAPAPEPPPDEPAPDDEPADDEPGDLERALDWLRLELRT